MASGLPLVERLNKQCSLPSYADYQRNMAKTRVIVELSKLIINQPVETDNDSSSNLFKILVKRFKSLLAGTEKDPTVCDTAARKLAKFVETVMKEAYFAQKYKNRSSSVRSHSAASARDGSAMGSVSRNPDALESTLERETIIKGLAFPDSGTSLNVEKVPRSFARNVTKCGPLYTAYIGGRKVFVQEVREGESRKALISRVSSVSSDPAREPSSWLVDLANKTKEWIKWLEDKASMVNNVKSKPGQETASNDSPPSMILEYDERERMMSSNARDSSDSYFADARCHSRDHRRPMTDRAKYDLPASSSNFMFSSSVRQQHRPPGSA